MPTFRYSSNTTSSMYTTYTNMISYNAPKPQPTPVEFFLVKEVFNEVDKKLSSDFLFGYTKYPLTLVKLMGIIYLTPRAEIPIFLAGNKGFSMSRSTISTFQLFEMFPDQDSARVYLEGLLWRGYQAGYEDASAGRKPTDNIVPRQRKARHAKDASRAIPPR